MINPTSFLECVLDCTGVPKKKKKNHAPLSRKLLEVFWVKQNKRINSTVVCIIMNELSYLQS